MKRFFSALLTICLLASFSACKQTELGEPYSSETKADTTTEITEETSTTTSDKTVDTTTSIATTSSPENQSDVTSEHSEGETTPGYDPGMPYAWLDIQTREIYADTEKIICTVNTENEFITDNSIKIQVKTENGWETYRKNYGSLSFFDNITVNKDNPLAIEIVIDEFYNEKYVDDKLNLVRSTEYRLVKTINDTEYYINFNVGAEIPPLKKEDIELYMPSSLIRDEQDSFEIKYTYVGKHEYAEYAFGCEYTLEIRNEKGEWEKVPFSENAGFIELAYLIGTESTNNSTTVYLNDDFYAEPLKAGTYRVIKPFADGITFTGLFRLNDGFPRLSPAPTDKDLKVAIKEVTNGTPITTNSDYLTLTIDYIGEYDYAEFMYGEYESLEKLVDGQWKKVEYADEVAWTDIGILVNAQYPDGRDTVPLDDDFYKEPLTAGKYRVVKEIADVTYYLEFEMTDEKTPPLKKEDIKVTLSNSSKDLKKEKNAEFTLTYEYVGNAKNAEYSFDGSFQIEKRDSISGEWTEFPFNEGMGFDAYMLTISEDSPTVSETIYISEEMFKEPLTNGPYTQNIYRIVKPLCDGVEVTAVFMLYELNALLYPSADDIKITVSTLSLESGITTEDEKLLVTYEYIGKDDFAEYEFISSFILERFENGQWIEVIPEDDISLGGGDIIPIGTETPFNETTIYPQFIFGGTLEEGKYRLLQVLERETVSTEFIVKKPTMKLYDSDNNMTLHIDEINKNGFICSLPWPYPAVYTVQCNADEYDNLCVGDNIEVYYEFMYEISEYEYLIIPYSIEMSDFELDPDAAYKPVIYLYPKEETNVSVKLDYNGELTVTYPEYNDGWTVTAMPDGTLYDENGNEYSYLFWEGKSDVEYDFSKGFCVKGEDTVEFLRYALSKLGLTPREYNEFIVFWLPFMQDNEYNIISFQSDCYTDNAVLSVSPQPDTVIRVFMAYYPSNKPVQIEEQELSAPSRDGFIVIEWGGTKVSK